MKLTIIIPAFNAEKHLKEAIDSTLKQTHPDFELLLLDDGSSDNTLAIMQDYENRDPCITVLTHQNRGTAPTLNRGLQEAKTDWVVIMHADDIMEPERIASQIQFIQENPDVKVSSCLAKYISETGAQLGKTSSDLFSREKFQWYVDNQEAIGLLHPGVILHRETALQVGGYRQAFWPAEDIDLWNRIAEAGHLILVQDKLLMNYRIHTGSASTSKFMTARMRYEWGRACMRARRGGKDEPSWDQFERDWNSLPLFLRLNRDRKCHAKALYHAAGHDCLRKNYLNGFSKLGLALLLQPGYVLPRLKSQVIK